MLPVIRTKSAGSPPPAEVLDKGFPSVLLYPLGQLVIWKTLGYLRAAFALLTSACPAFSPSLALSRHHRKTSCPQRTGQSLGPTGWSDIFR